MKKHIILCLFVVALSLSCSQDDNANDGGESQEQVLPNVAILGQDVTTGDFPFLIKWDEEYENLESDFLPDILGYDFGALKNTIDGKIAVAAGFPPDEIIVHDISQETTERYADFFNPENEVGNQFTLNTEDHIVTYYFDNETTCCTVFIHTYDIATASHQEFFIGNIDVSPVQFNTYVKGDRAFVTGADTFGGSRNLYIYDIDLNIFLGTYDINDYGGYFYNDVRDEVYLFNFNGTSLQYDVLDLEIFAIGESAQFIEGVTAESNFNEVIFEGDKMIFKQNIGVQSSIPLSAIYDFSDESLISYDGTDLFNIIFQATGYGLSITDTAVDMEKSVYMVSGTYTENDEIFGLVVFMNLDKEILSAVETGRVAPQEIILLN